MGKILSTVPRQLQQFNIENRAHKIISKDKPIPAPKYPGTIEELERIAKENPELIAEQSKKDATLDNRLKQVYIVSHDPEVPPEKIKSSPDPNRPLPLNRANPEDLEFGYVEPNIIPRGKVTLRQVLKFIGDHQADPKTWTIEKIADEYLLNKESTEKILKYFHTFEVYIPPNKSGDKRTLMAESSNVRKLEARDKD